RTPALPLVGSMGFDQPLELVPRQMLQQGMEYAILVRHGVAPFVSRNVWRRPFTSRINAVHHVSKNRAGQSWAKPWHDDVAMLWLKNLQQDSSHPAMTPRVEAAAA